jgi:hypothetical protein
VDIPRPTLQAWKRDRADRYGEIRARVVPEIRARMAGESEDLARSYAEAERRTLKHYVENLSGMRPAEAASSLRNLTTSRGISTDKASALRGLPTEITEHRSVEEIFLKWERQGFLNSSDDAIDGTAQEITDQKDIEVGESNPLGARKEAPCTVPSCTETGLPGRLCPIHQRTFFTRTDQAVA